MPASDLDNLVYWSDAKDLSKYDRVRAGPSDEGLVIMWSVNSSLLFLYSIVIMVVFLAIITNHKVRRNPFNKYIAFLCFPDFLFSFCCAITCLASALNNGYSSWEMCQFQSFYMIFGTSANASLNGLMAHEIYQLLRSSQIRRKYYPPSDRRVYITSLACYAMASVAASFSLVGTVVEWLPEPGIQAGYVCLPIRETLAHYLVWWFIVSPLAFGIPYVYAAYIFYDVIFRSKLLPPRGKRRELTVYFFRIGAMFLFLWTPTIAIMFIFEGMLSPWWSFSLGLFSHTQGLVSALVTMGKKDIGEAVKDFLFGCFRRSSTDNDDGGDKVNSSGTEIVHSLNVENHESSYQDTVDELGLPIQGSDFLFLDEASARFGSAARQDGPIEEGPTNAAVDEFTDNPNSSDCSKK